MGDYALTIARKFRDQRGFGTAFCAPTASQPTSVSGFEVLPWSQLIAMAPNYSGVVLHYVNYGFQKRGIPFELLSLLRRLRQGNRRKFVTIFHEFYASGPPWRSEFWLRPFQIHLGKAIARLSDECIVSSPNTLRELQRRISGVPVHLHPVPSTFGEPVLSPDQITNRDPHHWVIIGGTVLAERSLRSFRENLDRVPRAIGPRKLIVIGGRENPATRTLLGNLGIETEYHPQITAADASAILQNCSFGWFNYFARPDVETSVLLKSTAFAAACAHAVISVFPHGGSPISIEDDKMPGPFFVEPNASQVPSAEEWPKIAGAVYDWYGRHASSVNLVRGVSAALGIDHR